MKLYQKILAVLLFLPNITLGTNTPGLGRPEIFPWATLFVVRKDLRLPLGYILFGAYLFLSFAVHTALGGDFLAGARSLLALVNASVAFFAIIKIKDEELQTLNWAFIGVFGANVVVSLMQNFGLFPEQLVRPMRFFIERFEATPMGYGRGVGGLFAEPSYLALGIHHYFAYAMLLFRVEQKKSLGLLITASMALYDILIIRSATGLTIMVVYFLSHQNWRTAWKGIVFFGITGMVVLYFAGQVAELPRSLDIAYNALYRQNADEIFTYLTYEGGIRVVSLLSCYPFGIAHPFGWGIGSWPQASISAMLEVGLSEIEVAFFENYSPYDGFRPTAFSADLFLEAGVIGWLIFALALSPYVTQRAMWRDPNTRAIVVIFLFNMLILGTIGDPLPFVFLALAYRSINQPDHEPIPPLSN